MLHCFHYIAKTVKRGFLFLCQLLFSSEESSEGMKRKVDYETELEGMKRKVDYETELEENIKGLRISEGTKRKVFDSESVISELTISAESIGDAVSTQVLRSISINCLELRSYQERIVAAIEKENTIVLLPTGAGKTLIAAECAKIIGGKTLFLVPTCILVEQQAAAIRDWTGFQVAEYIGGAQLQLSFDILVSTPAAFSCAQQNPTNTSLSWGNFGLIVFDEVHHVLKHHPYRHLAMSLRSSATQPRILGLSASLTYEVNEKGIKSQVRRLCDELRVSHFETATSAELKDSGYHATEIPMEVRLPTLVLPMNLIPLPDRKPHELHQQFFKRIQNGTATEFASSLMSVIRVLEKACTEVHADFKSPLSKNSLKEWGIYAHSLAVHNPRFQELECWYESLKLLIISWEEAEDTATMFLRMSGLDTSAGAENWPPNAARERDAFFTTVVKTSFPRFENLKDVLKYKLDSDMDSGKDFRGIVFVDQRVSTHILSYVISMDPELSKLRSTCIYAAGAHVSASLGALTKREVSARVSAFADGQVNLLIATVVAEEGIDVAAANCVIRFDSMVHAVSLVQGRGRARQADSSFMVLSQRSDRPAEKLAEVEKLQLEMVANFHFDSTNIDHAALHMAQKNRETSARPLFEKYPSLAVLNEYCQKTKVFVEYQFEEEDNGWRCNIGYVSELRRCSGTATGNNKKTAQASAAIQLMQSLKLAADH